MDIIDVMIARALSPQGSIEAYATRAGQAASKAEAAVSTAESTLSDAVDALQAATEAVNKIESITTSVIEAADDEIMKLVLNLSTATTNESIAKSLSVTYPDDSVINIGEVVKYYKDYGDNEDGTMTQKAIKQYIEEIKSEIDEKLEDINLNLGASNAGKVVIVGPDGTIISGDTSEDDIIDALIRVDAYSARDAVGLTLDYQDYAYTRIQEAANYEPGVAFNKYSMFGGRMRCNVADDGTINAFYGDPDYTEDGSNGQVMIYQPKFYYNRAIIESDSISIGSVIRKESIMISATNQNGFKVHPIFVTPNKTELDYVLFSVYNGSAYIEGTSSYDKTDSATVNFDSDKLSSIAGVKPISGHQRDLTMLNAEKMAKNRGEGWHIMNLAAVSANQMLMLVEYGTPNGQAALGSGVSNVPNRDLNCASQTGSTASLGNTSGVATMTRNITNGVINDYIDADQVAISYRGMENPWGNIWNILGGASIYGNSLLQGGVPYICNNFDYSESDLSNYTSVGFCLPSTYNWVSAFGYGNKDYDWVFLPAECNAEIANSALPIGDGVWTSANLNGINRVAYGGAWQFGQSQGPYYYAFDQVIDDTARSLSARLMFIPSQNAIYTSNIAKWRARWGVS